jgi:hydrogenase maturation factor
VRGAGDPRVLVGPRIGEDAAVVRLGRQRLVIATDPVTFAADRIGWYAVHINANDVATMGARPAWFQACVLVPAGRRTRVDRIFADISTACAELGAAVTGGHTEVTAGIENPIVVGTMMGIVEARRLVLASGLRVGHDVVMTGAAAIEATAILAREFAARAPGTLPRALVRRASRYLFDPGISIVAPAMIAAGTGASSMHDPTEGGIVTGLCEMAEAAGRGIEVDLASVPVRAETRALTAAFGLDPLRAIASGSLLVGIHPTRTRRLLARFARAGTRGVRIGRCVRGAPVVRTANGQALAPQPRDEIAKLG